MKQNSVNIDECMTMIDMQKKSNRHAHLQCMAASLHK